MKSHGYSTSPSQLSHNVTNDHNTEFRSPNSVSSENHLQQSVFSERTELDQQSTNKRKVEETQTQSNHRSKKHKTIDSSNALDPLINSLIPLIRPIAYSFNILVNFILPPAQAVNKQDTGRLASSTRTKSDFLSEMQRNNIPTVKHTYKSKKKRFEETKPTLNMSSTKDTILEQLQRDSDSNASSPDQMATITPSKTTLQHIQSPGLSPINGTKNAETEMNGAWSKFLQDKSGQSSSPKSPAAQNPSLEYGIRNTWKNQVTTSVRSKKQNKRNSLDSSLSSMINDSIYFNLPTFPQMEPDNSNNNNNASRTIDLDYERTFGQEKLRLEKERAETIKKIHGISRDHAIDLTDDSIIFGTSKKETRRHSTGDMQIQMKKIQQLFDQVQHRKQLTAQETEAREQEIQRSRDTLRTAAYEKEKENDALVNQIKRRSQAGVKKLTEEEEKIVDLALDGDDEDVLAEGFNLRVTRGDICRLRTPEWLNDEVINFYMNVLMDRNSKDPSFPKVFIFNTFFFSMLEKGYERVKKWTRKVDVFSLDYLIIPVHLGVHWCLAAINFVDKRFEYYDSMGGPNKAALKAMRNYIVQEYKDKKKQQFDLTGWTDYMPRDIPQQQNGYDCGVFMCRYADCISQRKPFDFKQKDMQTIRKRMILDILSKSYSG